MAQLCLWTKIRTKQTVTRFGCLRRLFNVCLRAFCAPNATILLVYLTAKIKMSFIWKDDFFLPKSASSAIRLQAHLAKRKPIGWSIGFNSWTNWTLYGVISRSLCKMCLKDVAKMFNCWERRFTTYFLPQQQYSRVYALFLVFYALVSSQDNEHTELTVFLFFQNSYAIIAHIVQHYHDFQSNVPIFASVVQAYTQPYLVGRKDKTNYLSNQTRAKCYHLRNKHLLKNITLDSGPYIQLAHTIWVVWEAKDVVQCINLT